MAKGLSSLKIQYNFYAKFRPFNSGSFQAVNLTLMAYSENIGQILHVRHYIFFLFSLAMCLYYGPSRRNIYIGLFPLSSTFDIIAFFKYFSAYSFFLTPSNSTSNAYDRGGVCMRILPDIRIRQTRYRILKPDLKTIVLVIVFLI